MALKVEPGTFPTSKISATFQQLTKTASSINFESDKLTKTIESLDIALRALNLGVSAWVKFDEWSGEDQRYGYDQIGYDNIYGGWGLCLRKGVFDDEAGDSESWTGWIFAGAPRELRIRAIRYVPELIEALNAAASKVAQELADKNRDAEELAKALGMAASMERLRVPGFVVKPENKEAK